MKTIEAIIERLQENKGSNGCVGVFKIWVKDFKNNADDDYRHGKIVGLLWGLNAVAFISDDEHEASLKELNKLRWPASEKKATK